MPTTRILMKKIVEVLRLKHEAELSHNKIALACGLSKGVVTKYITLAKDKEVPWPLPEGVGEAELEAQLFPTEEQDKHFIEPDYFEIHQELKRKGMTLQLLWSEYSDIQGKQAYQYSQFCYYYRKWKSRQKRSMRQVHRAGEKLFIDYCGPTVDVVDAKTGETRGAQVFVAVFGASSYTYAEATWTQSLPDWIASHQRAFQFYGGVPVLLVPDNLRSAVSRACRYEPEINGTYAEMAVHYGTAVLPARPYKPKDKAKAEVAVQVVERWILARLRHQTLFSLAELNHAIADLLPDLNERFFQGRQESRKSLFESIDKPELKALPENGYEYAEWLKVKPGIDYHVEVEKRFYSVPHTLSNHILELRITATMVEAIHKGCRVAIHPRYGESRYSTLDEHMPKSHRAHREWSPGRFLSWAEKVGPFTAQVVKQLLEDRPHPEHGYRACLGVLNLSRRYALTRLEKACKRALWIHSPTYKSISSILKQGLDEQPLEDDKEKELPIHSNVRGSDYYH